MKCSHCGLHELVLVNTAGDLHECPGCNHQFILGRRRYVTENGLEVEYLGEDENGHKQFRAPDGVVLTATEET